MSTYLCPKGQQRHQFLQKKKMNVYRCIIVRATSFTRLHVLRTTTEFRFKRMKSTSRRFTKSDSMEPTKREKKNTIKTIQLTNVIDDTDNNLKTRLTFINDNDFHSFLLSLGAFAVEGPEGNHFRSLTLLDVDTEYTLRYSGKAAARIDGFISNTARAFESKANVAVMNALREMGHESVELLYAAKEVSYDVASKNIKGEFDGIVATASHLFVVEAKLHAKVVPLRCVDGLSLIHSLTSPSLTFVRYLCRVLYYRGKIL